MGIWKSGWVSKANRTGPTTEPYETPNLRTTRKAVLPFTDCTLSVTDSSLHPLYLHKVCDPPASLAEGCTDTVRVCTESWLWERVTRESNLPQRCVNSTLYQLSYTPIPLWPTLSSNEKPLLCYTWKAVSMAMTSTSCSHTICQKSCVVSGRGAWVAMNHHSMLAADSWTQRQSAT